MQSGDNDVYDYFHSLKQTDLNALALLTTIDNWPELAYEEMRDRAKHRALSTFEHHTLTLISNGDLNLAEVAKDVLNHNDPAIK